VGSGSASEGRATISGKTHLTDFYDTIARYYDAENAHFTDDLPLYSDLAANAAQPILDIGCGSGRVCLHLAQEGYRVTGVDTSAQMLQFAQRKIDAMPHLSEVLRLVQSDVMDFSEGEYGLILLAYNALMHFTSAHSQISLLRHLRSLLADDGLIIIDLPNAGEAYAAEDEAGIILERSFIEPDTGHLVMQQSVSTLNRAEQLLHVTWIYDEILADGTVKRTLAPLQLRYVFPSELLLMLQLCDLSPQESFGSYDQNPFDEGAERFIVTVGKSNP
jgi:SAM-dependent methyltransferase